jgi:2,3,4,5-tetrahydropyridine-2-carboxylate N-succinyltransferase
MYSINTNLIEKAWDNKALLNDTTVQTEIIQTIELLYKGHIRVAESVEKGRIVNQWIKKALREYDIPA